MLAVYALTMALSQVPQAVPGHVTLEVANPEAFGGHRIFHLGDVLGAGARTDIPGLPTARALLVFSTTLEDCLPAAGRRGLCARVAAATEATRARGGLVLGLVLVGREAEVRGKRALSTAGHPIPVAVDSRGLMGHVLGLDRPGAFLVVNSGLEATRRESTGQGSERVPEPFLDEVTMAFARALARGEEDGP